MGCGSSSEESAPPPKIHNISGPQYLELQIPRRRLDDNGVPVRVEDYELDRQTIENALELTAQYIASKGEDLTIITVGGAVNTLLLQTRQTTHDIDFFGTNINNRQRRLLDEAAHYAESRSSVSLGGEWLNNATSLHLAPNIHKSVTQAALAQNEIVFQRRGLKLIAAPWNYAFTAKLNRIPTQYNRPYDVSDAAAYLHHYIRSHGNQPVPRQTIRGWAQAFGRTADNKALSKVNQEYKRLYGRAGIRN